MVIMKNALWKDILRDINKSKGRFISIAAIITLGVMFLLSEIGRASCRERV